MTQAVRRSLWSLLLWSLISNTASAQDVYLLAIGVQNPFNVFPDRNSTVNSFNGIQTFPSHSPFGMNGRALYARIGWNF